MLACRSKTGGEQLVPVSQAPSLDDSFVHRVDILLDFLGDFWFVRFRHRLDAIVSSGDRPPNLRMVIEQTVKHFLISA